MRITTWNVNSIKQRLGHLLAFLDEAKPDVMCLQELKCQDDAFPRADIEAAGYGVETLGQKAYNGVALLVRRPLAMAEIRKGLPGDPDDTQARYVEALVSGEGAAPVRVASIYLPNGNPVDSPKYPYKLAFLDRLRRHARELARTEVSVVLAGDYNVIPEAVDVADPEAWLGDALFLAPSRAAFRALLAEGYTDGLRACDPRDGLYTFWDYQAGCWPRNRGIRIDHVLLSPQAADRLVSASVQKHMRGLDKPSDHVPVTVELAPADTEPEETMIIYGTSVSPYVRKVLVALFEKGVTFEHKPVHFHAPDPDFRAASPTGKIPALDDDGFLLADSSAILHYVEAKFPEPSLIPVDAKARGRAVWFEEYGDTELFPTLIIPFVERFLKPRLMKQEGDDAKAQLTIDEKFPPLFDYLESQLGGDYLVCDAFSIADISVATTFHNLRLANFEVNGSRWPKLAAWVAKTLERPSFVAAIAAPKN